MSNGEKIQNMAGRLRGELLTAEHAGYDKARRIWNGMIDRRPQYIVQCAGAADVMAAVQCAAELDLRLAVRAGGHSIPGLSMCDGGMVIDLTRMKGIRVDPKRRVVQAQAGVQWGEFDAETAAFGLATTGGVISTTGIAGLTLGGGIGWLMGKYGLACDNLVAADVVTADGKLVRASAEDDADLFWAIRGGGGNFGVVTNFEYQLHPVAQVTAGLILHPFSRAGEALKLYRETTAQAGDELGMYTALISGPDGSAMAAHIVCHCGSVATAEKDLREVRQFGPPVMDAVQPVPYPAAQKMIDFTAPYGIGGYMRTHFVGNLTDEVIALLVEQGRAKPTAESAIIVEHVHGMASRVDPKQAAFGLRTEHHSVNLTALWTDPAMQDRCIQWARECGDAIAKFGDGSVYVNYLTEEGEQRVRAAYGPNFDRLRELKDRYDPRNLFRLNQNIKPSHSAQAQA